MMQPHKAQKGDLSVNSLIISAFHCDSENDKTMHFGEIQMFAFVWNLKLK